MLQVSKVKSARRNLQKKYGEIFSFFLTVASLCCHVVSQIPDVEFSINEELAVSTIVGNLSESKKLFSELPEKQRSSIQYDVLDQGISPSSLFNITRDAGVISVARRIDRESLCLLEEHCVLKINILASVENSSQFESKVITVYFKVIDINDNSPTFHTRNIVLNVSESSSQDSVLIITGANDDDYTPEYKVKKYIIDKFNDVFSLSASQALDGSSEIYLKLKQSLDRETNNKYEFSITAYDGGSPPRASLLFVTVDITDENDNEPLFVNKTYNVTIDNKKLLLNEVILKVSATDADDGDNAKIIYDFSNIQKTMLETMFRINFTTGEINVNGPIRSRTFEFIVEATDSGRPQLRTQAIVNVNVINSRNMPPRISLSTVGPTSDQNVISVLEPGGKGFFVAFVLVDDDGDENVECQISSDNFMMVPVVNKGYKIVLKGTVDRESTPYYDLIIVCLDKEDPPLNSTLQFRVNIEDANDNSPIFSQQHYSRTISEGKKKEEHVLQVSASDEDSGLNGEVRYSLVSEYDRYFKINSLTGVISAVGELDREMHPVMTLTVYATDQGIPKQKKSLTKVSIILEDINDNVPEFVQKFLTIKTLEEEEGERIIANLLAIDPDEGMNGELEYFFIESANEGDHVFNVLQNGSVICSTKLDREKKANYSFNVMVRDKGEPSLVASARVVVEVGDINDNTPTIMFPKTQNYTVLVSNLPETGVVLSSVIAYDDDVGENGSLKFTIVSGNEDSAFEISKTGGELNVAQASRLKNNKKYELCISVSDNGLSPRFITTFIKIDVLFGNVSQDLVKWNPDKRQDYIIIIAAVSAVTFVFSILIILAICVVFKRDKNTEREHVPKNEFSDINDSLRKEKSTNVFPEISANRQQYSLNNQPSFMPCGNEKTSNNRGCSSNSLEQNRSHGFSPKGKSVSFILNDPQQSSSPARHIFLRNDLEPFMTFGAEISHPSFEDTVHHRAPGGDQCEDVISDTSRETLTSDSGRGNSVDDISFDQTSRGDDSPSMSVSRHSNDTRTPSSKQYFHEHSRKSYQPRFSQNSGIRFMSPELHENYKTPLKSEQGFKIMNDNRHANRRCFNGENNQNTGQQQLMTFGAKRQLSMTSVDYDTTTTTSGSYMVNPDEIRIDTFVGADIVV